MGYRFLFRSTTNETAIFSYKTALSKVKGQIEWGIQSGPNTKYFKSILQENTLFV